MGQVPELFICLRTMRPSGRHSQGSSLTMAFVLQGTLIGIYFVFFIFEVVILVWNFNRIIIRLVENSLNVTVGRPTRKLLMMTWK